MKVKFLSLCSVNEGFNSNFYTKLEETQFDRSHQLPHPSACILMKTVLIFKSAFRTPSEQQQLLV